MLWLTIHTPSLYSLLFHHRKMFYMLFILIYWYTIIHTIILQQHFHIFCYMVFKKLNKHPIFTHLTHGQLLYKLLNFKHWHIFENIQWLPKISQKFLIITQINIIHSWKKRRRGSYKRKVWLCKELVFKFFSRVYLKSICSQSFQLTTLNAFKQLEWNENCCTLVRFLPDPLSRSSSLRICC